MLSKSYGQTHKTIMTGLMVQTMELIILVTMSLPRFLRLLAVEMVFTTKERNVMMETPTTEMAATQTVSLSAASTVTEFAPLSAVTDSKLQEKLATLLKAALSTVEPSLSTNATRLRTDAGIYAEMESSKVTKNVMEVIT